MYQQFISSLGGESEVSAVEGFDAGARERAAPAHGAVLVVPAGLEGRARGPAGAGLS